MLKGDDAVVVHVLHALDVPFKIVRVWDQVSAWGSLGALGWQARSRPAPAVLRMQGCVSLLPFPAGSCVSGSVHMVCLAIKE